MGRVHYIHTVRRKILALYLGNVPCEIRKDVILFVGVATFLVQGNFIFNRLQVMQHPENKNPKPTEAECLQALRYEKSCVEMFYSLAELRCSLQEIFLLALTAKPHVLEEEDLPKFAFTLILVNNLLKEIESV